MEGLMDACPEKEHIASVPCHWYELTSASGPGLELVDNTGGKAKYLATGCTVFPNTVVLHLLIPCGKFRLHQPQEQNYPVLHVYAGSFRVSVNYQTLT